MVILIDDIAAFLEGNCSWDLREARSTFFERIVRAVFKAHGGVEKSLTIFRGSEYKCEG